MIDTASILSHISVEFAGFLVIYISTIVAIFIYYNNKFNNLKNDMSTLINDRFKDFKLQHDVESEARLTKIESNIASINTNNEKIDTKIDKISNKIEALSLSVIELMTLIKGDYHKDK